MRTLDPKGHGSTPSLKIRPTAANTKAKGIVMANLDPRRATPDNYNARNVNGKTTEVHPN